MAVAANLIKLYVGKYNVTADFRDSSWERALDEIDTTTYGQTAHTYMPSLGDGTMDASGFWAGTTGTGTVDEQLATIFAAGVDSPISFFMNDDVKGSPAILMKAMHKSYKVGASVGDAVMVDMAFRAGANGNLLAGIVLHALGAETVTLTGVQEDNAVSTTAGYTANLHVTATAGASPSTVVKIQHSADGGGGGTWVDLVTFATVTAATSESKRSTATTTINRYIRVIATLGGSTTSITFAVTFARAY